MYFPTSPTSSEKKRTRTGIIQRLAVTKLFCQKALLSKPNTSSQTSGEEGRDQSNEDDLPESWESVRPLKLGPLVPRGVPRGEQTLSCQSNPNPPTSFFSK